MMVMEVVLYWCFDFYCVNFWFSGFVLLLSSFLLIANDLWVRVGSWWWKKKSGQNWMGISINVFLFILKDLNHSFDLTVFFKCLTGEGLDRWLTLESTNILLICRVFVKIKSRVEDEWSRICISSIW
jgi:hypothetical protein